MNADDNLVALLPAGDAALIALVPELEQAHRAERATSAAFAATNPNDTTKVRRASAADTRAAARFERLLKRAARLRATTLPALRAKARAAELIASTMCDADGEYDLDVVVMRAIVSDLLALPGATP